jgi:hypothetical protein
MLTSEPEREPERKAEPDHQLEEQQAAGLFDYDSAPIKYKKQIADLRTFLADKWGGHLSDTELGHRDADLMLDQVAIYRDGAEQMDRFLQNETDFDEINRELLKQEALARAPNARSPAQLGKAAGLLWATRKRLGLTNLTAIDTPPGEVLDEMEKAYDREYSRQYRAARRSEPKPPSKAKRMAANKKERRAAEIYAAVGDGAYVSDICKILSRLRHTPFCGVKGRIKGRSLSEMVRRAIKVDPELQWEIRPIEGRPDLIPQMWVTRRPARLTGEPRMTTSQPPLLPTNRDEYRAYLAEHLVRLDEDTVTGLGRWYYSEAQTRLRESCGISPKPNLSGPFPTRNDEEFIEMAIARRRQLLGK